MFCPDEKAEFLSFTYVFGSLPREELEELSWRLPETRVERGQVIYAPGQPNRALFVLREGRVRIYRTFQGKELTLAVVRPGTMFGEMDFAGRRSHRACAQALEPSELLLMRHADLRRLISRHPEVGMRLIEMLDERLRRQEERMTEIAFKEAPARIASLLLHLAEEEGVVTGDGAIKIPTCYTHRQLASMIGTNRETVSRALGQLQRMGAIDIKDRRVYIRDPHLLREISGTDFSLRPS